MRTRNIALLGIISALIFIMSFTPIGYLKVWIIDISFISIPVAVGAITMGPVAGAFLGFVFGITSFIQCFGMSPFGEFLLGLNPYLTAVLCIVPRTLMGLFVGLLYKLLKKVIKRSRTISYYIASCSAAVFNTILFISFLSFLFIPYAGKFADEFGKSFWALIIGMITINSLIEAVAAFILGGAISHACMHALKSRDV